MIQVETVQLRQSAVITSFPPLLVVLPLNPLFRTCSANIQLVLRNNNK